jgi:hypothetical protein
MFFRREKPHEPTFAERIAALKHFSFSIKSLDSRRAQVMRDGIAAVVEEGSAGRPHVNKAGLLIGDEIALLVNRGYQVFWRTPSSKQVPANATQLKALHNFEEDMKEGLGLPSLYNESLGTTSDLHLYDRVEDRDQGIHKRWEGKPARA